MKELVIIEPYNDNWPRIFNELRLQIVNQLGTAIQRIDHIGSTAVVGLAAKPIIDIQISVSDLDNIEEVKSGLHEMGFKYREDNADLTKRYFRERPGMRRTHIHVRQLGSWSEQFNLLFRDYLREHEVERTKYAQFKYDLADQYRDQRNKYVEGKTEIVWNIMLKANKWSQEIGWKPSKPDL
ncbi:GrpB family protein [Cohnella soli]|uniref:GrpB family protein n=1 Tax=Cohnella soli TaxID=425005 RepID=A0ABW0I025_9BACL